MSDDLRTETLDALRDAANSLDGAVLSAYLPRPLIQTGGDKWDILQKNALQAFEAYGDMAEPAVAAVSELALQDFSGLGIGVFTDGTTLRTVHLKQRPIAVMDSSAVPFFLPVLADLPKGTGDWVIALDKDQAALYLWTNGQLIDMSDRLDAPSYDEIENRRAVQDDVFFHNAARGRVGGHRGPAIFHALGTAVGAEREKTDDAYFLQTAKALAAALPPQTDHVVIAGDSRTAGHFQSRFNDAGISTEILVGAGEALHPEQLAEQLRSRPRNIDPVPSDAATDTDEITKAARNGRVERLFVSRDLCGVETGDLGTSEHLAFRVPDGAQVMANGVALSALQTGAGIGWRDEGLGENGMAAALRWDV